MEEVEVDQTEAATRRLDDLAASLDRRGFSAEVSTGSGKLQVLVRNRAVAQLSDAVYAAPAEDGAWWLWWSWADQLAPIDETESAAFKIAYVLTPA